MKTIGVTQRVFRDPTPQFPIRHKDRRREDDRPQREPDERFLYVEVPEGRGQLSLNTVPVPTLGSSSDLQTGPETRSPLTGMVLGVISLIFLVQNWLLVGMSMVSGLFGWDSGLWSEHLGFSFVMSLYGVHLFGWFSSYLTDDRWSPGVISIVLFWFGLLGSIPLGFLLSKFMG